MPHAVKVYATYKVDRSVKNRCHDLACNPLCVHVPDGATCLCPDGANFLPGSDTVCEVGEFVFIFVM